ncbi:MAG: hypothetical protein H7A25_03310 [Leptospiraceae bacterium]|nr:hypothetical protein [Leptospiraceae bacterium]MCP5498904.1 hypothetical protein [Leptospiraceae bacterium]
MASTQGKKRTFRFTIITILTGLILLSSGLVYAFSYWTGKDSVGYLAGRLMEQIGSHTLDRSLNFLKAATTGSILSEKLARKKLIETNNSMKMLTYSHELLELHPHFEMIYYGDIHGNLLMVKKMEDKSFSIKKVSRKRNKAFTIWIHDNPNYKTTFPNLIENAAQAYDPRERPWFKKAEKEKTVIWTDAYIFFSDQKPGITCASPVYGKDNVLQGVISIDIGLAELSYFLATLKIGEDDKIFILNDKEEIIALPATDAKELSKLVQKYKDGEKEKYRLLSVKEVNDAVIRDAYLSLSRPEVKKGEHDSLHTKFRTDGKVYVSSFIPFPKDSGFNWKIGIVMAENNFMSRINKNNKIALLFCIFFALLATFIGILFSRKVSRPLALLAEEMDQIKEFRLDENRPIKSNLSEVSNIASSFERMRTALKSFMKYVPAELVRDLVNMHREAVLGGEKQELTIFFSDIANFTSISEKLPPEKLVEDLETYLSELSEKIIDSGGTVDKYIGDAVMAFWGAPRPQKDHHIRACSTALKIQQGLTRLFEEWERQGKEPFFTRIGISTGEVVVGNMGSNKRINYTVIGDTVNLASRLEGQNKVYGTSIMVGESTYEKVKDQFEFCLLDKVAVKGKKHAVRVYELLAEKGKLSPSEQIFVENFQNAFNLYEREKFQEALKLFTALKGLGYERKMVDLFIERCKSFIENPPPVNWDGAFIATTK